MKLNSNKQRRKPRHFIPNILTLLNMFLGFLSISLILNDQPLRAGVFIIIAGLFDVFDGKIARMLGIESRFGVEFDSMADTVSFCVVPSVLIYSLYVNGLPPLLGGFIAFIPLMFGTIRLAKFNIEQELEKPKSYTVGLTTPIATITLFSFVFFNHKIDGDFGDPRTALMLVAALGILMLSPIHFVKFPLFSFKSGRTNSILLIGFILSMIGMAIWQGYFLLPLVSIYIGWNIINWLINSHRFNSDSKINL
jgi:CDP-diacylglycerol--serine O-phosphatidyltransferase